MPVWLIRAGASGQYEEKFLGEKQIYLTWDGLNTDLKQLHERDALLKKLENLYPDKSAKCLSNWGSQIWPFAHEIDKGDLVIIPLKTQRAIQIGEVVSDYQFSANNPNPFFHWRKVDWIGDAIPRTNFGQDLLYSFGAFMTICRIRRNNAEERINAMRKNGWKADPMLVSSPSVKIERELSDETAENTNLETLTNDRIVKLINARFKGHNLTRLVDAILKAQGYTTYVSPEGADGGVDILAGSGPLGFDAPRLCVEVKSGDSPVDRPTVDKLLGAMSKFAAQEGLFISWSGFKNTVPKEMASSFFRMRLWSQKDLLEALFANYDHLDGDIKAELPLKRIWTVVDQVTGDD